MPAKFEQQVKEALSGFSIEPSPSVWEDVEEALHTRDKRKKVIIWWWLPLTAFIILLSIQELNKGLELKYPISGYKKKYRETLINPNTINKQNTLSPITQIKKEFIFKKVKSHEAGGNAIHAFKAKKILQSDDVNKAQSEFTEALPLLQHSLPGIVESDAIPVSKNTVYTINDSIKLSDSLTNKAKTNFKKPSDTSAFIRPKNQWLFSAGIGLLATNNTAFASPLSSGNNSSNGSINLPTNPVITNENNGFHVTAGAVLKHTINKRWSYTIGIKYNYQQAKQVAGAKVDSSVGTGHYYYKPGSSNSITNYAHSIKIPLTYNLCLNPNNTTKIVVSGGIDAEYIFLNKWLIPDDTNSFYFYNSSLMRNVQINLHSGLGVILKNNTEIFSLIEYPLTPLYRFNGKEYFKQLISIDTKIPLSLFKRKQTK